jgi:hypothetical protein
VTFSSDVSFRLTHSPLLITHGSRSLRSSRIIQDRIICLFRLRVESPSWIFRYAITWFEREHYVYYKSGRLQKWLSVCQILFATASKQINSDRQQKIDHSETDDIRAVTATIRDTSHSRASQLQFTSLIHKLPSTLRDFTVSIPSFTSRLLMCQPSTL